MRSLKIKLAVTFYFILFIFLFEDQACGHLLPHPVATRLVKPHSKPVTLGWNVLVRRTLVIGGSTYPPLVVKFSEEKTRLLEGGRGSRPVSASRRFGREVVRKREKPSGNLGQGSLNVRIGPRRHEQIVAQCEQIVAQYEQGEQIVAPANACSASAQ